MKYIIIGGEAAGMSAASKIKRMQKDAAVHVYEKGGLLSYSACGLPYYVAGYNDEESRLIARSRGEFEMQGIETWLQHEAVCVDVENKVVIVKNLQTGEKIYDTYDRLMIATGAYAIRPKINGIEKEGVCCLKTIEDARLLKEKLTAYGVQNVVVIGGGMIGVEAAETAKTLGKNVVCLEQNSHILGNFDPEISKIAEQELKENRIELKTGESVQEIAGRAAVREVITNSGHYPADLVIAAVGVRPATEFLQGTGIQMAPNGAIIVDRTMQTSVADIWAAGDCAQVYDCTRKENIYFPMATVANKCGRIAGENMCGGSREYMGTAGTSVLKVCGIEIGRTGLGEQQALKLGYHAGSVTVEARNHPAYYPGSFPLVVKVIYERPSMKILGAQLAGREGAALRTDIFAVAMHAGMTAKELGMSDLAYSPPFSGVWDAVQIACNAAR